VDIKNFHAQIENFFKPGTMQVYDSNMQRINEAISSTEKLIETMTQELDKLKKQVEELEK
jgi:predicted  nucleic acid-binding Zn-ribbon protein